MNAALSYAVGGTEVGKFDASVAYYTPCSQKVVVACILFLVITSANID